MKLIKPRHTLIEADRPIVCFCSVKKGGSTPIEIDLKLIIHI